MLSKNKILAVFILILALFFGSFQERAKISVNNILQCNKYVENYDSLSEFERKEKLENVLASLPKDFYSTQKTVSIFYKFNLSDLNKMKWVNTVLFILAHFTLNALILFFLFNDRKTLKLLTGAYAVFFFIAIAVYLLGKIIDRTQSGYNVARKIVGFLQSQIPLMVFVAGYYLNKKTIK